ncbi:hypothetical protein, partial [Clostridium tarantellae]
MKYNICYTIRLNTIEDTLLTSLQYYLKELKLLNEYYDLIKDKHNNDCYEYKTIFNNDPVTNLLDYNSTKHKLLLNFFYKNNLKLGYNIIIDDYAILLYSKRDLKYTKYFKANLGEFESSITEKCIEINNKKLKSISLTENFIIFNNSENLVCNKDILKKIQFQQYNNGYMNIYFINKNLGEFLLKNNFTGFQLKPVNKIDTNEVLFYQMIITNIIEQPRISTEFTFLNKKVCFSYPTINSILYNYFKKNIDIYIYDEYYMKNNFCDFNISYYSLK